MLLNCLQAAKQMGKDQSSSIRQPAPAQNGGLTRLTQCSIARKQVDTVQEALSVCIKDSRLGSASLKHCHLLLASCTGPTMSGAVHGKASMHFTVSEQECPRKV